MSGHKPHGHYCKICGEWKANEKFSGSGHANHICKSCSRLPIEKRNEIMTVNRIMNLPFRLNREQRGWLEKMKKNPGEEIREAAQWAYEMRFLPRTNEELEELEESEELWNPKDLSDEELKKLFDGFDDRLEIESDYDIDLTELPFKAE